LVVDKRDVLLLDCSRAALQGERNDILLIVEGQEDVEEEVAEPWNKSWGPNNAPGFLSRWRWELRLSAQWLSVFRGRLTVAMELFLK
jgi:hypothetical protein